MTTHEVNRLLPGDWVLETSEPNKPNHAVVRMISHFYISLECECADGSTAVEVIGRHEPFWSKVAGPVIK